MRKSEFRYYRARERNGKNARPVIRGRINGQVHEFVTEATSKTAAATVWREYVKRVERECDDVTPPETYADLVTLYLSVNRYSGNYRRNIEQTPDLWVPPVKMRLGDMPAADIVSMHLQAAAEHRYPNKPGITKNTMVVTPAAAVLHFAANNELIPYRRFRLFKRSTGTTRRPAEGVPALILQAVQRADMDLYHMLFFMFGQGVRINEACNLRWADVFLATQQWRCSISKVTEQKTMPLHPDVADMLERMDRRPDGYVFKWRSKQYVGTHKIKPIVDRMGLTFTSHMCRHEFVSRLTEEGYTPREIMEMGTWTSAKSVERYQTLRPEDSQIKIARLKIG